MLVNAVCHAWHAATDCFWCATTARSPAASCCPCSSRATSTTSSSTLCACAPRSPELMHGKVEELDDKWQPVTVFRADDGPGFASLRELIQFYQSDLVRRRRRIPPP